MKLYYAPGACSLAVHIALREVGAPFDSVAVDLARHVTADGTNYFDISPRGYVPLLQLDDGSRHTEAASLLKYVADVDPTQAPIGPAGSARRPISSPNLQAHVERVAQRPREQAALVAEGRVP